MSVCQSVSQSVSQSVTLAALGYCHSPCRTRFKLGRVDAVKVERPTRSTSTSTSTASALDRRAASGKLGLQPRKPAQLLRLVHAHASLSEPRPVSAELGAVARAVQAHLGEQAAPARVQAHAQPGRIASRRRAVSRYERRRFPSQVERLRPCSHALLSDALLLFCSARLSPSTVLVLSTHPVAQLSGATSLLLAAARQLLQIASASPVCRHMSVILRPLYYCTVQYSTVVRHSPMLIRMRMRIRLVASLDQRHSTAGDRRDACRIPRGAIRKLDCGATYS